MAHPWRASKTLAAADDNGIAESQTPGAGAITLDGDLVVDGVAILDTPRQVSITSGGTDTGITFTVIGTNGAGHPLQETITGGDGGAVATTQDFLTVTEVTHTGSVATTVIIGTNGVGSTPWFVVDNDIAPMVFGIEVVVSGTVNYTVDVTYQDPNEPFSGTFVPVYDLSSPDFADETASKAGSFEFPIFAIRLTINSGTGTAYFSVIQAGQTAR